MRLSPLECTAVATANCEAFPAGTRVLLFGSRLDDGRRGRDIDLPVELPAALPSDEVIRLRSRFVARLYGLLDKQRIDVVVTDGSQTDARAVVAVARQSGIELARA